MKDIPLHKKDEAILRELRQYIADHASADLSIATLAKQCGLNQEKIKRGFRLLFGVTVHHYIMNQRMASAKHYLLESDEPLKAIAAKVGYSQRNFFSVFKRYAGITPGHFRGQGIQRK